MKNKRLYLLVGLIILIVICCLIIFFLKKNNLLSTSSKFIYMNNAVDDRNIKYSHIITSYEEYYDIFESDKLTRDDFKKNNYAVIYLLYNSCGEKDVKPVKYSIENKTINVDVKYRDECGYCADKSDYYLLPVDKSITYAQINIDYEAINKPECDINMEKKPLIYLYPESEMNVSVKLGNPEKLVVTYPKYNDGWTVIAKPNGDLVDSSGRTYYGLYWEGKYKINNKNNDGFVVKKEDTVPFLEEKLKILGLNEREANEFIIYWLPILEKNKYNYIRFEDIDIINKQMPLYIAPKPDSVIRVLMEYKPLKNKIDIKEQELKTPSRYGFSVVEWGGTLIK